jgi:hypothetical protein
MYSWKFPSGEIKSLAQRCAVPVQRLPCREGKHFFAGGGVFM